MIWPETLAVPVPFWTEPRMGSREIRQSHKKGIEPHEECGPRIFPVVRTPSSGLQTLTSQLESRHLHQSLQVNMVLTKPALFSSHTTAMLPLSCPPFLPKSRY
jgi:hypothetical protein